MQASTNEKKVGWKFQQSFSHTVLESTSPGFHFEGISKLLGLWFWSTEGTWKNPEESSLTTWTKSPFTTDCGKAAVVTVPFLSVEGQCWLERQRSSRQQAGTLADISSSCLALPWIHSCSSTAHTSLKTKREDQLSTQIVRSSFTKNTWRHLAALSTVNCYKRNPFLTDTSVHREQTVYY